MKLLKNRWFLVSFLLVLANLLVLVGVSPLTMDTVRSQDMKNCDASQNPCADCQWRSTDDGKSVRVQVPRDDPNPSCGECNGIEFDRDCGKSTCTDCEVCSAPDAAKPGGFGSCETCHKGEKSNNCGEVDGTDCGSCRSETKTCNDSINTCTNPCNAPGIKCGTVDGVECTNECKSNDKKKKCDETTNTCFNPCEGVECGVVDGVRCENECQSISGQACNTQNNQCVPEACKDQKATCGTITVNDREVDCGSCTDPGEECRKDTNTCKTTSGGGGGNNGGGNNGGGNNGGGNGQGGNGQDDDGQGDTGDDGNNQNSCGVDCQRCQKISCKSWSFEMESCIDTCGGGKECTTVSSAGSQDNWSCTWKKCSSQDVCGGNSYCLVSEDNCQSCEGAESPGKVNGCTNVPDSPCVGCKFNSICDEHDKCYGSRSTLKTSCGNQKTRCDQQFLEDLKNYCKTNLAQPAKNQCLTYAEIYGNGIGPAASLFGTYEGAQQNVCCYPQ